MIGSAIRVLAAILLVDFLAAAASAATFNVFNVDNSATAQAVASSGVEPNVVSDSDSDESHLNPASAVADATAGSVSGHAEAQASWTQTATTLHLAGRAFAIGETHPTAGATGSGVPNFNANQDFGNTTVWLNLAGTFTRSGTATGSGNSIGLFINGPGSLSHSRTLDHSAGNASYSFNDFVQVGGFNTINISGNTSVSNGTREQTYDVTMTLLQDGTGAAQNDALLPTSGNSEQGFFFSDMPGGNWFDPPAASAYNFQADLFTQFTKVGLPVGVEPGGDGMFTISGSFGSVTLAEGSTHTFASPINAFTISGINPLVDGGNPAAFPTYLEFTNPTGGFTMTPVPEPSHFAAFAIALIASLRRPSRRL